MTEVAAPVAPRSRRRAPRRAQWRRTPIRQAVNVGDGLAGAPVAVEIADLETLEAIGAPWAWVRLLESRPEFGSVRVLYALEGAIAGVRWPLLAEGAKAALRMAVADGGGRR